MEARRAIWCASIPSNANASRRCVDMSPSRNLPVIKISILLIDSMRANSLVRESAPEFGNSTHGIVSASSPLSPSCDAPPRSSDHQNQARTLPEDTLSSILLPELCESIVSHQKTIPGRRCVCSVITRQAIEDPVPSQTQLPMPVNSTRRGETPTCLCLDKCPILFLNLQIAKPAKLGRVTICIDRHPTEERFPRVESAPGAPSPGRQGYS